MDETSVAEAYRSYGAAIWRRCVTLLGNEATARDVAHDVFVLCIQHRGRLHPGRELLGWLYRVATNLCLNQLRHQKVRGGIGGRPPNGADLERDTAAPSGQSDPTARILIREVLGVLDARSQELAIYVFVDGMTHAEAAEVAEVSERTVRNCLERVRDRGRQIMNGEPQEES